MSGALFGDSAALLDGSGSLFGVEESESPWPSHGVVVIVGDTGAGKTALATLVMGSRIRDGYPGRCDCEAGAVCDAEWSGAANYDVDLDRVVSMQEWENGEVKDHVICAVDEAYIEADSREWKQNKRINALAAQLRKGPALMIFMLPDIERLDKVLRRLAKVGVIVWNPDGEGKKVLGAVLVVADPTRPPGERRLELREFDTEAVLGSYDTFEVVAGRALGQAE